MDRRGTKAGLHQLACYPICAVLGAGEDLDAMAYGEESLARARALGAEELYSPASLFMANILAERVDRALALTEELPVGPSAHLMSAMVPGTRGIALTTAGRLDEAGTHYDRSIELATAQGNLTAQDVAQGYYASHERHRGFPTAALAHGRPAVELAEQVGSPAGLRQALYQLGHAHLASGDLEQARSVLERALASGPVHYFSVPLLSALAKTLAQQGEHDRACETAREAISVAEATGQSEISPQIALARALRLADGRESEGPIAAALERAEQLSEEFGARVYLPQILEERAELARLRDDEAARARELGKALRLFTEMGATGHAERLARELGSE